MGEGQNADGGYTHSSCALPKHDAKCAPSARQMVENRHKGSPSSLQGSAGTAWRQVPWAPVQSRVFASHWPVVRGLGVWMGLQTNLSPGKPPVMHFSGRRCFVLGLSLTQGGGGRRGHQLCSKLVVPEVMRFR